nr:hypothetical protein [Tanacetum cinerariifolium]
MGETVYIRDLVDFDVNMSTSRGKRAWNLYVKSKGIEVGWHVHFVVSSRQSMLYVVEYNKDGMPTSRLYNFGRYAPVCLTYVSSQSKHVQILPKRFFDVFKKRGRFDLVKTEKYEVMLHFIQDPPRGFCGLNWTDFLESENVSEGQKMVVCHVGGFRCNVTIFDFNGIGDNIPNNQNGWIEDDAEEEEEEDPEEDPKKDPEGDDDEVMEMDPYMDDGSNNSPPPKF